MFINVFWLDDIRKVVLIQIHVSTYMFKSFDCQEGKHVKHADGFQ